MIISASELDRIKQTLLPDNERPTMGRGSSAADLKQRSQDLHQKSLTRAKSWTNTLEGSRRKKAEERARKFELKEIEAQKVDAMEAKIQLDQRRYTIERANKLLHEESDRMKSLQGKMMMCDMLAEREAQVQLKDELRKLDQIRDDRFLEMEKQNYRKMLEREMKEKETLEALSGLAAKAQKEQLAVYKEKRFREIEDDMLEGELLRRKAIEDLASEKKAEKKRRAQAIHALQETQKANEYLKQIKAEDVLRQEREEQKIQEYAERKERMLMLRKQKEDEVFQSKQNARNAMIDAQARRLAEMQGDEDQRVENQVKAKHADDERKRLEKEAQMKRWEADIQRSRQAQIDRKLSEKQREKAEDQETAKFLGEWCKVLDKQEQEELHLKHEAAKSLAGEHKKMVEIQRRRAGIEKKQEAEICRAARKAVEADVLEFHDYAEKTIREYSSEGKNVIPLIKELREFRKRSLE